MEELTIAEQAARWFYALQRNPAEQAAFGTWLAESPRHVEEFLLVSAVYRQFDKLDPAAMDAGQVMAEASSNVVALQRASAKQTMLSKPVASRWKLAAAAAMLAVAVAAVLWMSPRQYSTDIGEQRAFDLADGSVVYLNTRSRVQVSFSDERREIKLLSGEALFKVAPDRHRPFEVRLDSTVIRALGTQFNVYRRSSDARVSVLEAPAAAHFPG